MFNASTGNKPDPDLAPVQSSLSYLGMPGLTVYFSLLYTGSPKEGETILISATFAPDFDYPCPHSGILTWTISNRTIRRRGKSWQTGSVKA